MQHLKHLISFYNQFFVLVNSDIDILRCLDITARNTPDRKIKRAILRISDNIKKGETLAESFSLCPEVFSPIELKLIECGESSGHLDIVLKRITDWLEFRQRCRRRFITNLVYPIILLHAAIMIPPLPMAILKNDFMFYLKSTIPALFGLYVIFAGLCLLWLISRKIAFMREGLDFLFLRIPVLRGIIKKVCTARFCFVLRLGLEAGISVISCLKIAANVCGNEIMKKTILLEVPAIEKGESIGRIFLHYDIFPRTTHEFWQTGEESGKTVQMMARISEHLRAESEFAIEMLMIWIPRVIYFAAVIYVALIIIGMAG